MKLHSILFVFILANCSSLLYSQVGAGRLVNVVSTIYELEVIDSLFLKDIDSLLLKSNSPVLKDSTNKYFTVYITKSKENSDDYQFQFELFKIPIAEYGDFGYFEYKGYTFFVGENALMTLFKRKQNKKRFTYMRGEYARTEEFPMWVFSYKDNRLILLESIYD